MKNFMKCFSLAAFATLAACSGSKTADLTPGIRMENMDTTVVRGNDFYQYACGGWMKNNPLTGEYSRYGSFDALAENNRTQMKELISDIASQKQEEGSISGKIATLYNMVLDSTKLNKDGVQPIKSDLASIDKIASKDDVYTAIPQLYRRSMVPFFGLYVGADDKNSNVNIIHIYQSGIAMGERDYYLKDDSKNIRDAYKEYVAKMFKATTGCSEKEAKQQMNVVLDIETRIAKASRNHVELRDPDANYNKMTLADLAKKYPTFNWKNYLESAGLKDAKSVNIGQPEVIAEAASIINKSSLKDIKTYLKWQVINAASSYLNDDLYATSFDFYGKKMSGRTQMQPRWKRAVSAVNGFLGEAVGQMYVKKYFPAEAKARMVKLVKNLQTSLGQRIQKLEWMSDETKAKALDKLSAFHIKVGYPDKWKDYSNLDIKNDSYWANRNRASEWEYNEMVAKMAKPVDKDEWMMTPQTVNAYYNPGTNEICFPAGILQYPFFDMNADDAFNYGAIGVVIGHEMTHGFDDQGRKYNKEGNLEDWWTAEDSKQFNERTQVLVNHFGNIEVAPGVKANGKFTLGENIADHGGLQVSFQAFKNATANNKLKDVDGFTPEQRFFLAYANVWANNIRPEEILRRTKSDEHSLGRNRVNGALPQIDAWYEAFNITEKDSLYLPKEKRASIW